MSHTVRQKQKLLARVRRIRGQVEAIERALESEAGCAQVMHLIAGARGAMSGLMAEVKISIGGQQITSIITASSAREMQLKTGQTAAALIKATEVMILRV